VRQGDALSSVLFDLVLEAIFQKMNITGCIGTKSAEIFAYADDVATASRNKNALKDTPINTKSGARKGGFLINANETKCMEVTRIVGNGDHLRCGKHEFERVKEFSRLGPQLNQTNSTNGESQTRILSGNRCYYAYGKLMKSRALNRSSKLKIRNSLIILAVTDGWEVCTLSDGDEQCLRIFECRILREIFGAVQNEDGSWRIRINHELNELIENADIVRFIEGRRIAWLGHVMRMDEKGTSKRVLEWKPTGRRIRGRPRKRWIEDVKKI
jgi:hypothetical protein